MPRPCINLKPYRQTYHGSDPRWLVEYLLCRGERKLFHGCRLGTKYRWGARTLLGLSPNGRTNLGWYYDSTPPLNRYLTSNSVKKYPLKSFSLSETSSQVRRLRL